MLFRSLEEVDGVDFVRFGGGDVVRHRLVQRIVEAYDAHDQASAPELRTAVIHRIELPQGRFERQVPLPAGVYEQPTSAVSDGCLIVRLPKVRGRKGAT